MEMDNLAKRLQTVLDRNIDLYGEMISVLDKERESLVAHSLDEISESVKLKTDIAYKIKSLESERLKILGRISKEADIGHEEISLTWLADRVDAGLKKELFSIRSRLRDSVDRVTEMNVFNRELIENLMRINYGAASHLNDLLQPAPTYDKRAPDEAPLKPGQVLNRKM